MLIEQLPDRRYYGIGEVAAALQVNTSLIRFWEKEFDVLKPKKNAKGDRKFTKEDLEILDRIFYLVKEKGYTLEGAKQKLKEDASKPMSVVDIIIKLESVKRVLLQIKQEL